MQALTQLPHDIDAVLVKPREFFSGESHSVRWSIGYTALFMALQTALSIIFADKFYQSWSDVAVRLTGKVLPELQFTTTGYAWLFGAIALATFIFLIVLMFVLYLYFRFIGGSKASLADTSTILAYGFTPNYVFGWIPYVSAVSSLWSLCLVVYGFRVKHPMPLWRFVLLVLVLVLASAAAILYTLGY